MKNSTREYEPIKVDFSVPLKHERNQHGKWYKLIIRVGKTLGFYRDFTYVNQINEQLKVRKVFPRDEWEKVFENVNAIEKVLKETSLDSCKANYHYIPSDLLLYVIWDDVEGHVADFMSSDIRKSGIGKCSTQDIISMAMNKFTLQEFFSKIINVSPVKIYPTTKGGDSSASDSMD